MSDRDASISDAAFREALSKLCAVYARNLGAWGAYDDEVDAARARVLALYAEAQQQGERDQLALAEQVAEATMRMEQGRAERQGDEGMVVMNKYGDLYVNVTPQHFENGDRVRVTKVEEARSDCPLVGCTIIGPHDHNPTGPWQAKEAK